jgi:uncharacterized protein (TIGR02270 family)
MSVLGIPHPPVIHDILAEHMSELGSLWRRREKFVFSFEWTLKDLADVELRAGAHLDGLRIGAGHSIDVARILLNAGEKDAACAATFTLMAFESPDLEREVLQALKTAPAKSRDGIRIGMRHSEVKGVASELSEIAVSAEPAVRAAAVDLLAFHRLPLPKGISTLLRDPDPEIRRIACESAGRFGGPWSLDVTREALESDNPSLRLTALRTSARLGLIGLDETCRQLGTRPQDPVPEALEFLGVLGDRRDLVILQNSIGRPSLSRAALGGIGSLGSASAIPALLEAIADGALAPAAGRAFLRLTGASGIAAGKPIPPPEGLTPEEIDRWAPSIPLDPRDAGAWWELAKGRFAGEARWQWGLDISKAPLGANFALLPLASRLDVYLGERARDPQRVPDLELACRATVQRGSS